MKNIKKIIWEVFDCDENSEIFLNEESERMTVDFVSQGILCMTLDIQQIAYECKRWALNKGFIMCFNIKINPSTFTHIIRIENYKSKEIKIYDKESVSIDLEMEYKFIFLGCNYIIDNILQKDKPL